MDENNRNFLMAIVLSVVILLVWQYYFVTPKQQQEQTQTQTQTQTQPGTGGPSLPQPDTKAGTVPQPSVASPGLPTPTTGAPRETVLAASPRVKINTPSLSGSISLTGLRIDDLVLRKFRETTSPTSPNVTLFSPAGSSGAFYAQHGWQPVGSDDLKVPDEKTVWTAPEGSELKPGSPVTFTWDNGEGLIFKRTVSVDVNYMFTIKQIVENKTDNAVALAPYAVIRRHETPKVQSFYILHEGLVGVLGKEGLQEIDYEDALEEKEIAFQNTQGGWLGITDKYWASVIVPNQKAPFRARFLGGFTGNKEYYQTDYLMGTQTVEPGGSLTIDSELFAGAKETQLIDGYEEKFGIDRLDLLIDWGWFYFLTKPLFFALDFFYKLVGNFGLAILIVTVLIKLAMFPLANKSYVSMSKMKKLQPEMTRIKERYADDKTRQQKAMMELYSKEKVNPASGCLPILVQIPVFFALYKVLFVTIEMRHAPFYGWIQDLSAPDPTSIFNLFGLIPWEPPAFLLIGIWPLIMGVTMAVQMRLNPAPPDPVQAKVFAWMPVIFTFLLAPFPAGLVIYWAWNNLLSIAQQAFIMKKEGVPITLFENMGIKKKKSASGKS